MSKFGCLLEENVIFKVDMFVKIILKLFTLVEGIELAVAAFIGLFQGKNVGKMVVKLT